MAVLPCKIEDLLLVDSEHICIGQMKFDEVGLCILLNHVSEIYLGFYRIFLGILLFQALFHKLFII